MRLPHLLLILSLGVVTLSGAEPYDRQDWLLENALVIVALPLLVCGYRFLRFTNGAYFALFGLLCLHEVGAHFTYSLVPYADWLMRLGITPSNPQISRNGYDRCVHMAYGVLVMPATLELFSSRGSPEGIWRYIFPLTFVMAHSTIYELLEWAAASLFGGSLGQAYLGTQGDPWDAQKDMLMASSGAALALLTFALATKLRLALKRMGGHSAHPVRGRAPGEPGAPPPLP